MMNKSRARSSTLQHLQKIAATTVVAVACNNSGYAVVDPMPIPSKCAGTGQYKGSAIWKMGTGEAGAELQLVITLVRIDASVNLTVAPSANIVNVTTDAQGTVTIVASKPLDSSTSIQLGYSMSCAAGTDERGLSVYWSAPPVEGRVEQVSM